MAIKFDNVSYLDKIKNMTYTFEDNKITSIIGASGSGKTLLSYMMTGLVLPDEGAIAVEGNIIDNNTKDFKYIRKIIGYVFQNPEEEFFTKSVKEELEFSLKKYKFKLDKLENRVLSSLKMVGLKEKILERNPHTLSKGEQEKLAIAISLSLNPKIILLDEPTVFLDDKSKKQLTELLLKLKEKYNKTIIIISNDINFVNEISDNILMLKKGKIALNITKDNFIDNIEIVKRSGIEIPKIIEFINMAEKYKNKKIKLTDNLDELVGKIKENV